MSLVDAMILNWFSSAGGTGAPTTGTGVPSAVMRWAILVDVMYLRYCATAPGYFDNLKRIDSVSGTILHRGNDIVTEFPAQLHLSFLMYDLPCTNQLQQAGSRGYLTHADVSTMRLSFFWKHGMKLRPATGVVPKNFETRPVQPYAVDLAAELPERFEWIFEFDVPSAGVPVTDSLVVILRTPDGHIAARAAARM